MADHPVILFLVVVIGDSANELHVEFTEFVDFIECVGVVFSVVLNCLEPLWVVIIKRLISFVETVQLKREIYWRGLENLKAIAFVALIIGIEIVKTIQLG
jgi:hypothetical protein